jgi:hypothetical protein
MLLPIFASAACFDRHGRIISQKHSDDRKMEDRKMIRPALSQTPRHAVREIKFVMISHSGKFAVCSIPSAPKSLARKF